MGKRYWVIERTVEHYAAWRKDTDGRPFLEAQSIYVSHMWRVVDFYPMHDDQPPSPENTGESYTVAHTYSKRDAQTVAQAMADKHGGEVAEFEGIVKSVTDPNSYDPKLWG